MDDKVMSSDIMIPLEELPCGICRVAVDNRLSIIYANDFFYEMFGYSREQALSDGIESARSLIYPPDYRTVITRMRDCLNDRTPVFELEHRTLHRSGEYRWTLVRCRESEYDLTCALVDITERKNAQEKLRISEEEKDAALKCSGQSIDIYDIRSRSLTKQEEEAGRTGLLAVIEDVPQSILDRGLVSDDSRGEFVRFFEEMQQGIPNGRMIVQIRYADGNWRWIRAQYTLILGRSREPERGVISYEDVTRFREKEMAYQKWCRYFGGQKAKSIGYYEYNLTRDLYDGSEQDLPQILPERIRSFTGAVRYFTENFVYEEDIPKYLSFYNRQRLLGCFYSGREYERIEYRRKTEDGGWMWVKGSVQLIPDPYTEDVKAFILVRNIDEDKRRMLRMKERLEYDTLTGIMNRASVTEKITQALADDLEGREITHAFAMIDIDFFKQLNDTYGHQFGDQALREVAGVLKRNLRGDDLCGRLGGDEFVVLLKNVVSPEAVEWRLDQLRDELHREYGKGVEVSVSIGMACFPRDGKTFDDLYQKADIALYEAKNRGRNRFAAYSDT